MNFRTFGNKKAPTLLLIPGLGVSYEICYHWTGFWKFVFHSHYFDVLLDECRKTNN